MSAQSPRNIPRGGPVMGMSLEKPKNFGQTLRRFIRYLKPQSFLLLIVLLTAICSQIFAIFSPKMMGKATTKLFEGMMMKIKGIPGAHIDFRYIGYILLVLLILYLVSAAFGYIQQYVIAGVAQRTVYDLREEIQHKLERLPLSFFDRQSHGEILSRAINDVDNISTTLQQSLTQLVTSLVMLVGVVAMMLYISPLLTVVVLLTLPLSLFVTKGIAKRSQHHFSRQQASLGQINGHVEEMFTGHTIVKAYGHEEKAKQTFRQLNEENYESSWKAQFFSGIIMPLMGFVNNIGYVLVSVIGGILVIKRSIEIGDIQAFIQYARQFSQPITQLANIANILQATIASAERIFELLDEPEEEPDHTASQKLHDPQGEVRFEDVHFRYQADTPLIESMNINVAKGQTIAIVGPTGAGKTTLTNLLMRFYELDRGRITIDGINIAEMKRSQLRQLFGMVLQETWLFGGTIRENIAYSRPEASDEEIYAAARAARADHFIRTLPQGYDTVINEEASNLSQGQKQLLTIARAILADPVILILDEATSSVDTRTEVAIQKAMDQLMQGRTSFVIAHRLSTIRNADLILVMNHGQIIEQGTHKELLAQDGFYAELYNSQFTTSEVKAI